jgi:hypothetical protein
MRKLTKAAAAAALRIEGAEVVASSKGFLVFSDGFMFEVVGEKMIDWGQARNPSCLTAARLLAASPEYAWSALEGVHRERRSVGSMRRS